ncbi:MAG TPA: MFS transporter, partial [Candidatus Berkiella sp.]|nr:MFS transporter [Candidatus Berkiella sp.]
MNGWFQAWGWPACCKQLNYWFAQSERGLWYSICSTSHNLGGALIPIIAVFCAIQFGWRYAMFVPAVCSILMGFVLMNRLRDVPRT